MDLTRFLRQMLWLRSLGFVSLGVEELRGFLEGRLKLPRRSIVFAFDDGYNDIVSIASTMKRLGFKGVVFAVPGMSRSLWEDRDVKVDLPLLDLGGLRRLLDMGWDIGSHSLSHRNLRFLDRKELVMEVLESKRMLEEGLGVKVDAFSYPYGQFDEKVVRAVKDAGYFMAFTTKKGRVRMGDDHYLLKRIAVGRHSSTFRFLRNVALRRW